MKAHKSKHFKTVLQTMILFKIQAQPLEKQLSQAIKLMSTEQLYQNIIYRKYDTMLMKQILIFLIQKFHNPNFEKYRMGGASHFLKATFVPNSQQIFDHYYTQIALSEYFFIHESKGSLKQYVNSFNFCELDQELKFAVLQTLVKNVSANLRGNTSKTKEKEQGEPKDENQSKTIKIQQFLVLGQDNKYVYYYAPFLPEYVITYYLGQWDLLDKFTVIEKIRKLLSQPMNTNALFLCQSLDTVCSKFMRNLQNKPATIRFLSVKQDYKEVATQRMKNAKKELLLLNERYCRYLKNFDNQCWGYYSQRQKYIDQIQKSQSLDDLIEAHSFMYRCSSSKLYKCLCDDQSQVPENKESQYYEGKTRYHCNIHTISVPFRNGQSIKSQAVTLRIIKDEAADMYTLFEFNIYLMKKAMEILQDKKKRYYAKQDKRKSAMSLNKQAKRTSSNSNSVLNNNVAKQAMGLRPRKNERKKKFGVTMIDSDESFSEQDFKSVSTGVDMRKYEYKTRSCIQR